MDNLDLINTFSEFKELKNIDKDVMVGVLEDVFRNMLAKTYGSDENFDVIINLDKGDFEIWRNRIVVEDEDLDNENMEISLTEAKTIDSTYEVGEEVSDAIPVASFGRRSVLSLRQNLASKILDLEKSALYDKYKERIGEIVIGEVYQVWKKEILVLDDDDNELILPRAEQIPSDYFRKGEAIKAIVTRVEVRNNTPIIILSRTSEEFLRKLFEMEVPEVYDGLITIKKIVRIPGERAKIAVESYDERIDPVGACVGVKGARIYSIVKELKNENIDVVNYATSPSLFIQRALSPAKVNSITIDEQNKVADVKLNPEEVSLAIGKNGQNIKLAIQLTGYSIDVYRDIDQDEDDIPLTEFKNEIDSWVIDELIKVGCNTAHSVLAYSVEDLAKRADLEVESVELVMNVIKSEFAKDKEEE